jgi:diguanylate cyclase
MMVTAAVAAAAFVLVFFLWIRLEPGGDFATAVFSDVSATVVSLLAGVLCIRTAMAARRRERWGWALIGAGTISWSAGEMVWATYEIALRQEVPFPSLADVGFLGLVPLAIAGIAALTAMTYSATARTLLDGLVIAGALLYVSWATVLGPTVRASDQPLASWIVSLAYPIADVVMASMVLILLSQVDRQRWVPLGLLGVGILALAVADSGFVYLSQFSTYTSGAGIDAAWIAGFLLIGLGAMAAQGATSSAEPVRVNHRLQVALPYAPLVIALIASMLVPTARMRTDQVLFYCGLAIVGLVVLRQLLTLRENLRLNDELKSTVHDLRSSEEQLRYLAFHDPLTGLANRALFQNRMEHALAKQSRVPTGVAVLYIDLDGFKPINDEFGHAAGDELLVAVGKRLASCVRGGDTVARIGGDEFAVLLAELDALSDASAQAVRIVEAIAAPVTLHGKQVRVTASVGVAVQDLESRTVGDLLRDADVAMYAAKLQGKGRHALFDAQMRENIARDVTQVRRPRVMPVEPA